MIKNKIIRLIFIGLFLVIMGYWVLYLNTTYGIGLICVFNKITGLYCSGCGMTRALLSILRLDFYQAFRYNAFSIIILPIIGLYIIGSIYSWIFGKTNFMYKKIPEIIWIIFIVALLLYGVLRNIPQFSYLAPTNI